MLHFQNESLSFGEDRCSTTTSHHDSSDSDEEPFIPDVSESSSSSSAWGSDTDSHRRSSHSRPSPPLVKLGKRRPRLARVNAEAHFPQEEAFSFAGPYMCSSKDHLKDGCGVLAVFGLFWSPEVNAVVSQERGGGCLIPAGLLLPFLSRGGTRKRLNLGCENLSPLEWGRIVNHIQVKHNTDPNQTNESLARALPSRLTNPLPVEGMSSNKSCVSYFYQCPACLKWAIEAGPPSKPSYNIADHYRNCPKAGEHGKEKKPKFKRALVQKITIFRQSPGHDVHWFELDSSDSPDKSQTNSPPTISFQECKSTPIDERIQDGTWVEQLGWTQYLRSLGPHVSVSQLRALVELPSPQLCKRARAGANSAFIEMGLLQLHRETSAYLENASAFIEDKHPNVRISITSGSKSSKYRQVSKKTFGVYRKPLVLSLAFMIRFFEIKQSGDSKGLGNFEITGTAKQVEAARSLWRYFLETKGVPNAGRLRELMHTAFDTLLRASPLETRIATPVEQMLFLTALVEDSLFISPNAVQSFLAALQYCFRTILVHVVRLQTEKCQLYSPWIDKRNGNENGNGNNKGDEEEDDDEEDDEGDSDFCEDDEGDVSDWDELPSDLEGSPPKASEQDSESASMVHGKKIMQYLDHEKMWVQSRTLNLPNTPYVRLRDIWFIIHPYTRSEHNGVSFRPSEDGQRFEFFNALEGSLIIDMIQWRKVTNQLCNIALPGAVGALLPSPSTSWVDMLQVDMVCDHHGKKDAVHKQLENVAAVEPIHKKVLDALLPTLKVSNKGESTHGQVCLSKPLVAAWFQKEQKVLAILASIFALSSGPTFRSFQLRDLQYDASPDFEARNLYFLPDGRAMLANPKAKQLSQYTAATALAFPPSVTQHLCFFFWVLKPVGVKLLALLEVAIPMYSWRIWVNVVPHLLEKRQKPSWKGGDFNKEMQGLTRGAFTFPITFALIRTIAHAVLRNKLPSLFSDNRLSFTTLLELIEAGSLQRYASKMNAPAVGALDQKTCCALLLVSDIWQMALGISEPNPLLQPVLQGALLFPTHLFAEEAFYRARGAVQEFYSLNPLVNQKETMRISRDILAQKPFISSAMATAHPCKLGDSVLRAVTYTVLFGDSKPQIDASPPLGGLHIDDVALAASQIVRALQEWESPHSDFSILNMDQQQAFQADFEQFCKDLSGFKKGYEVEWIQFSYDVFALGHHAQIKDAGEFTDIILGLLQ